MSFESGEEGFEEFPVSEASDTDIVMHREVHFGGSFDVMLEYYLKGGKGIHPDFDIERIYTLAKMEKEMKQNIATVLLSGADAEKVARAKEAYKKLRKLYEMRNPKSNYPVLIADLILSEEEEPQSEIAAVVKEKGTIVPALLEVIRSEDLHDTLFPGYGLAPTLAVKCLGLIGDQRAIITLFESLGTGDFFDDDIVLTALHAIGEPARKFLLTVLHGKPLNIDNEKAAMALIEFKNDPEVAEACLKMLHDPQVLTDLALATYLALVCEGLKDPALREQFLELSKNPKVPKMLQQDIKTVAKSWNKTIV